MKADTIDSMRSLGIFRKNKFNEIWQRYYLLILVGAVIAISSVLHDAFLTKENIMNVLASNAMTAMVALGMFFVILTGGIDLSVGSIIALSCCLLAGFLQQGFHWFFSILFTLIIMCFPGVISGVLITRGQIPPFMATLSMMTIVRGLAYMYQVGSPRLIFDKTVLFIGTGEIGWIPMPVLILIVVFIVCAFVLGRTIFGRRLYAIGGNALASFLSGVLVKRYILFVYIISSFISALAGVVLGARLMMGAAIFGQGYELDAIASVIIGGASMNGGSGTALNTVLGAFVFGFISNILNLVGVTSYMQMVIKGIIIFTAVLVSRRGLLTS